MINEICNAIVLSVGPKYFHLLKTNQAMKEKISEFKTKFGMIEGFGCIDGNHIANACPSEHSHDYFYYKQFDSLSVQAVYAIIKVHLWMLNVSGLVMFTHETSCEGYCGKRLLTSDLPTIVQTISNGEVKISNYQFGDTSYPLLP